MSRILYAIGEVSRMTGLSIKALRLYQDRGLLAPTRVDEETGYRYYAQADVERARSIRLLRDLHFSIEEIQGVFEQLDQGEPLAAALSRQRERLAGELAGAQRALAAVDALLRNDEQAQSFLRAPPAVIVRDLSAQRALVVRGRGRYADGNQVFPRLFAASAGRVAGPPFCLYHEAEYREADADISWCVPVTAETLASAGISVETIPAARAATVMYTGPWDAVGPAWACLFAHLHTMGAPLRLPLRETYVRGPGSPGDDPRQYVTELAALV